MIQLKKGRGSAQLSSEGDVQMGGRCGGRHSTSLIASGAHIKTTGRRHLAPGRAATVKKRSHANAGEDLERGNPPCEQGGTLVQPLWKTGRRGLRKLKIERPYDPAIPRLGICPQE